MSFSSHPMQITLYMVDYTLLVIDLFKSYSYFAVNFCLFSGQVNCVRPQPRQDQKKLQGERNLSYSLVMFDTDYMFKFSTEVLLGNLELSLSFYTTLLCSLMHVNTPH